MFWCLTWMGERKWNILDNDLRKIMNEIKFMNKLHAIETTTMV